ncbi:(d)CMP kinase [Streptococcus macacae]|uniref:Cytidylate kinase n=1 Tax=Streptococcus macacae NCTC 11558 TaxID=764298 RepID=G5JZ06_9STRE|nr:(d)CMP kinase [Streptococcus macacae]EHJ53268.1 cytidylate kinase [Streptococcus macacae NCTC 11558]SUN78261.1 cytidylate kinase [Streptococcus macacae NCTC 11558]
MTGIKIAIDGPASSGKSTVAKIVARDLDYIYLDTGAMYRSATYLALKNGVSLTDEKAIIKLLREYPISFGRRKDSQQMVFVGDVDITDPIRGNEVTNNVSTVAALPLVRQALVELQQQIANQGGIVMDGRDIGTVVLPDADLKIFMLASVEERARRRYKENLQKGIETDFDTLKEEIAARDYKDSHRKTSPLKPAEDAITFDTTDVDIAGVVTFIEERAQKIIDSL